MKMRGGTKGKKSEDLRLTMSFQKKGKKRDLN